MFVVVLHQKPKGYPRKLQGQLSETEIELQGSAGHILVVNAHTQHCQVTQYRYSPLETAALPCLMERVFGHPSLYSEDHSFQTSVFPELLADQSFIS